MERMESTSPFLKRLQTLFKALGGYDSKSRKFNMFIVWFSLCCLICLSCTIYRFHKHDVPKTHVLEEMTNTVAFTLLTLSSFAMYRSRDHLGRVLEDLFHPIDVCEENPLIIGAVKEYTKWVDRLGSFFMVNLYVIFGCLTMALYPLLKLTLLMEVAKVQDWPLPYGRIPFHTDSYAVYAAAYIVSATPCIGSGMHLTWYMTMAFAALKAKLTMKLLAADIRRMDEIIDLRADHKLLEFSWLSMREMSDRDRKRIKGVISIECRKYLLKELVERHVTIIRNIKKINECFSLSSLFLIQMAGMISALILPMITQLTSLPFRDVVYLFNGVFGSLMMVACVCKCGQMITDEDKKLTNCTYRNKDFCASSGVIGYSGLILLTMPRRKRPNILVVEVDRMCGELPHALIALMTSKRLIMITVVLNEVDRQRMQRVRAHRSQQKRAREKEIDRFRKRNAPVNLERAAFSYDPEIDNSADKYSTSK
ncbi:hypothetical protein J6590_054416 [Homalodisca vitripennis]|nr:hypothetical protein J6590_054416 [Homalodisca vitripennis]